MASSVGFLKAGVIVHYACEAGSAEISPIYSKGGSTSIAISCGNTISFAISNESTTDFIRKKFKSMKIKRVEERKSLGVDDRKDSISISLQTAEGILEDNKKGAVIASE